MIKTDEKFLDLVESHCEKKDNYFNVEIVEHLTSLIKRLDLCLWIAKPTLEYVAQGICECTTEMKALKISCVRCETIRDVGRIDRLMKGQSMEEDLCLN